MITKNHSTAYSELFKKAEEVLTTYNSKLAGSTISHIDDYFACLQELARIERENPEKIDPIFTILPATEETFNIDADKRTISIPDNFAKYGIGVQGDEIAEIIYFSIDRYFDAIDLSTKDILIQWRHEKDAPNTQNLSATYKKSLTLQPGKIVFGWPISSDITKTPGNIQFSVRFYEREGDNDANFSLIYSFSTLTATIKIQSGLNFEITKDTVQQAQLRNKNDQIYKNLRYGGKAESKYDIAKPVFYGYYIYKITADGEQEEIEVLPDKDLVQDLPVKFISRATIPANEKGEISTKGVQYQWYYTADKNQKALDISNEQGIASIEFIEIDTSREGETYNPNEIYFRNIGTDSEPVYQAYYVNGDNNPFDDVDNDGNKIKLYVKRSVCEPQKAGYFSVKAVNNYKLNEYAEIESNRWYVPFAEEPIYTYENETKRALLDDNGRATLTINASVNDNGVVSYKWYHNPLENSFEDAYPLSDSDSTSYSIDVFNNNENEEGYYYLKATNVKNNSTSKNASKGIFVAHTPSNPVIDEITVDGQTWNNKVITSKNPVIAVIMVDTQNLAHASSYKYQWYSNDGATLIPGATDYSYRVKENGNYICKIINTYKGNDSVEISTDTIPVSMNN